MKINETTANVESPYVKKKERNTGMDGKYVTYSVYYIKLDTKFHLNSTLFFVW